MTSMTLAQVTAWAAAGESEILEFKRTTGERRAATQTLCAMLNHRGGRVLFGIPPDHRVVGQDVSDHTLEEVAHELKEIDPPVYPTIERVPVGSASPSATAARYSWSPCRRGRTAPTATGGKRIAA